MNILAIRFARLGDTILLLPALASIKRSLPEAHLSLLTGHRCAPIAELSPFIDTVISVDRIAMRDGSIFKAASEMTRLVGNIRSRHFDAVIDFHSFRETNLLARLSGAAFRVGMRRSNAAYLKFCFNRPPVMEDKTLHVSEMFQKVAQALPGVAACADSPSVLRIPESMQRWASAFLPRHPLLALYVDAPVSERRWPPEFFASVADFAAGQWGAHSIVLSSPGNAGAAERVKAFARKPENVKVFSALTLPQVAAAIQASTLLISNDTGPMHLGPALGVATLGLFSVGLPEHFRPAGPGDRFLQNAAIERIPVEEVIQEMERMWVTAAGRVLPR